VSHNRWLKCAAALGLTLSVALGGCVVQPARVTVGLPLVTVAPPAPQVEVMGAPPAVGYVWLGGYWNWVGGQHVWVGGHWEAPHPGYRWVPHVWVREGGGWRLHEGHWARR
jgi:hypothetical protein